jgi:HPr kinase/phosphorylase
MPHRVTVQDLYDFLHKRLDLEWLAGEEGRQRRLVDPLGKDSARVMAAPLNFIHPNRVQTIGQAEHDYLTSLNDEKRLEALELLFNLEPAAVILVNRVSASDDMVRLANESKIPLLSSPNTDNQVLDNLLYFSSLQLADKVTVHGVFMEVLGMGVLLTGDAAVGKSELALELLSRGNRLIADDAPEFARIAPDTVSGTCPPLLREFLEVRGLGILNVRAMFGDNAIKRSKYLRLIVKLQRMDDQELTSMDRLTGTYRADELLGVTIPEVTIPVAPGRNLAILVETAVRNHLLKLKGYDATEAFVERQQQAIRENE